VTTEIWVTFALSLQKTLYVVAMHVNITFSSSSHKKGVLFLKIYAFTRMFQQAFSTHCSNTSQSLIGSEYIKASIYISTEQKVRSIDVRWSCRPVDWASTPNPLPTESLVQVLSETAGLHSWDPHKSSVVEITQNHPYLNNHWFVDICWPGHPIQLCE